MTPGRKTKLRVLHGVDPLPDGHGIAAMIRLVRVFGLLTAALAQMLKPYRLTLPIFDTLLTLRAGEGICQQQLAERLLITKGNVCVIVQKMQRAGLLQRRPDPTDQRSYLLYLTAAGRRLIAEITPEHDALFRRLLARLTPTEQKSLDELLGELEDAFDT